MTTMPPEAVAHVAVQQQPAYVDRYLRTTYPGGPVQIAQSGKPDDIALAKELLRASGK